VPDIRCLEEGFYVVEEGGPFVGIVELNDGFEGVGELEGDAARWGVCEELEEVRAEGDAVRFVNDGGGCLAGGETGLEGVFPVHAVFEPDGAGLAGGTGVGLGLERMEWGRRTDRCWRWR